MSDSISKLSRLQLSGFVQSYRTWWREGSYCRENVCAAGGNLETLVQTAKMNKVNPHAWLTQTLERIAQDWPIFQIKALHALELQNLNGPSMRPSCS